MREKWQKQMPLMAHILDHPQSKELEEISTILDTNPTICHYFLQDLNRGKSESRVAPASIAGVAQQQEEWHPIQEQ